MNDVLAPELQQHLRELMLSAGSVTTVSNGQRNTIESVGAEGVRLTTAASEAKGIGPQLVPAWMLNVAWDHLRSTGALTNRFLLASDGLNVKRSSAVCALLAEVPGVTVASARPIELRFNPTR